MNRFDTLFNNKFKGCPLLATAEDVARERTLNLYYIGMPGLVGVNDGVDTWMSPVKGCFHSLKDGLLDAQIALAAAGTLLPEVQQRHKLIVPIARKVLQRRVLHAS